MTCAATARSSPKTLRSRCGVRRSGWRLVYDPAVAVDHYPGELMAGVDHRGLADRPSLADAAHNETVAMLDYLPPLRRAVFLVWATLVGTRLLPGAVVATLLALRGPREIIEEEEADLTSYVEDLEEDSAFEELEEETSAAEDYHPPRTLEIAATGEPAPQVHADESERAVGEELPRAPVEAFSGEAETEEEVEEDGEEAEIEDAQAEAEALLEAEARGNGTVDARVEVRAPASTAGYTQRARRPEFDRRRGRRGGRRFRAGGGPARRENSQVPQISDLLKEGQEILVQIAKEPIGKKGARITSHIALPGRFLVYMPTVNHTGVSRKIASDEERQRLKRIIISERENGHGGFIVRTAAAGASEDELRADIRFLKGLWNGDQESRGRLQVSGLDLSRPQRGRARSARPGHFRLLCHLG